MENSSVENDALSCMEHGCKSMGFLGAWSMEHGCKSMVILREIMQIHSA